MVLRIGTRLKSGHRSVLGFCEHGNGASGDSEARTFFMSRGTCKLFKENFALEVGILCQ